ncbi:recombinase family protein [Bradyrhizobium sp. 197]|uniref:recombinase family protein n=1 Tax=Bradyrhizobium sp. 197 TaxID=2782663 RepID=UPI001FFAB0FD|nr:recombinase family protein [Bradyrhizobium sp. 197]MCK1481011.1 recombinase family protein [Bradyrhizobium sp. 197]
MNREKLVTSRKLIAIYARVSTARQEEEGTVETQLIALRDFARQHGYNIVKEYIDDGWSGDILARPSLDQLRQDARGKTWQAVLVYDPDRLARRYSYQELVMDELREAEIEIMFVTVSAPKNSEEKILHGVRGLFAEYERAKIAERFRLGKLRKVKDGHILVSEALYGYNYIPKLDGKHGYYEIDPVEARIVKLIFSWVAYEGCTLRKVVRKLQGLGIKPRRSKRGVWNTSTLSTLLRHKGYIGEAHWGASYAVAPQHPIKQDTYRKVKKTSRRMRPGDEWFIIPVPAIIDKELFERARAQLDANFALSQRNKKNEYLLAGKIRCVCGRTRTGEGPMHGKHLYYRCSDRVLSFPLSATCKERGINARAADKLVWEKIANLMGSEELLSEQISRWLGTRRRKVRSSDVDVAVAEKEVATLKVQEDRYNKAYGAGLFTVEQLREYTTPLRKKLASLENEIANAQQETSAIEVTEMPSASEIKEFSDAAQKMLHNLSFQARRAILLNTVEKVVGTPEQLQVHGFIPVKDHVEFKTIHRHRLNAARHVNLAKIPFEFRIPLPPPRYERTIMSRDGRGRITRSAPSDQCQAG